MSHLKRKVTVIRTFADAVEMSDADIEKLGVIVDNEDASGQRTQYVHSVGERDECPITPGMVEAGLEVLMMYPSHAEDRATVKNIFKAMDAARRERRSASWLVD
jgi:hypothetical protein